MKRQACRCHSFVVGALVALLCLEKKESRPLSITTISRVDARTHASQGSCSVPCRLVRTEVVARLAETGVCVQQFSCSSYLVEFNRVMYVTLS